MKTTTILDIHSHSAEHSPCGKAPLLDLVLAAGRLPLDGICATDHDALPPDSPAREGVGAGRLMLLRGVEIFTTEGDILCYGLERLPPLPVSAADLVAFAAESGAACVAAHPFRDNGRGLGNLAFEMKGINGIEAWNGNTDAEANEKAARAAAAAGLPALGGSDAHDASRIGTFATAFSVRIHDVRSLADAIKAGACEPVRLDRGSGRYVPARSPARRRE